jgi:Peptidase family M1 domain
MKKIYIFLLIVNLIFPKVVSQNKNLFIPLDIKKAYERESRSYDGQPGKLYSQNYVKYHIEAEIDPFSKKLKGYEKIKFYNNFSENQQFIVIRLYYNFFKKGAVRGRPIEPEDAGEKIRITSLKMNEKEFDPENKDLIIFSTETNIVYPLQTNANDSSSIEICWEIELPAKTHERFGPIDSTSYFVAYWYPQIAVYDDINGWDLFDYTNLSEVYNEYADFDVQISIPENFVVWATGDLLNSNEIFQSPILNRLNTIKSSGKVYSIIEEKDINKKQITKNNPLRYKFSAKNVSDFAFGYSDHYLWDAAKVKLKSGKTVFVESAYLPSSHNFKKVGEIAAWVVQGLSEDIPGYEFPYPSMTVFNGDDGMEFPMIVNDHEEDKEGTYFLTTHEMAHSYLPFLVGTNQRRHGWVDEGLITMIGVELHKKKIEGYNFRDLYLDWYPQIAGTQQDLPGMVNSVYISDELLQQHDYMRSSLGFWTLRDIMGEDNFNHCLHMFFDRWKGKHPTPYDLFFTINDVSGENFNWFYQPWFVDFAYPDIGIDNFTVKQNIYQIRIKNYGGMPFPTVLKLYFTDKSYEEIKLDARVWNGKDSYLVEVSRDKVLSKIFLNTYGYPDVNQENNQFKIQQ